jgi:hypothetical protein
MEIVHKLSREGVLDALNIEPPSPATIDRFLKRYTMGDKLSGGKETTPFFLALRSRHLRVFVDAWLQTGLCTDGSESPFGRDLFGAPTVWPAALRYLETNPPRVTFSPVSRGLSTTFGNLPRGSARLTNPFEGAEFDALRHFVEIISSDWDQCLCKCRLASCGRYFLLEKPRRTYKRGAFCCVQHQPLDDMGATISSNWSVHVMNAAASS